MRGPRCRVAVLALAALAAVVSACHSKEDAKAEAARRDAAAREALRATKLAESLKALAAAVAKDTDAREGFAMIRKNSPASSHADIAEVERCQLEQLPTAVKAAGDKRFQDVAAPVVDCMISMEALRNRVRRAQLSAVLLNQNPSAAVRLEMTTRGALLEMVASTLQVSTNVLGLMLDYGPPETRLSTFEAIAQKLPTASPGDESARALLQRGYTGETIADAKDKMATRLKALGVPLQPESPSPAAAPAAQP